MIPIPRTYIITNINMVRSVDSAKLKKLVGVFKKVPHLSIPDAMKLAKYSCEEVSNLTFRRFLRCTLLSGMLNGFRALLAGDAPPPNCSEQHMRGLTIRESVSCSL
jgi:hypothetical protein